MIDVTYDIHKLLCDYAQAAEAGGWGMCPP